MKANVINLVEFIVRTEQKLSVFCTGVNSSIDHIKAIDKRVIGIEITFTGVKRGKHFTIENQFYYEALEGGEPNSMSVLLLNRSDKIVEEIKEYSELGEQLKETAATVIPCEFCGSDVTDEMVDGVAECRACGEEIII